MELHCKDCKYFSHLDSVDPEDKIEHGLCTFNDYYEVTTGDVLCPLQTKKQIITCSTCTHFDNDPACLTQEADDTFAARCWGYENKDIEELRVMLRKLFLKGYLHTDSDILNCIRYIMSLKDQPYVDENGEFQNDLADLDD